jgi:hypothetical protein
MVTLTRLGRKRRLVFMFEWLTLCPTCAPLPVNSQRRDMAENLRVSAARQARGTDDASGLQRDRGRIESGAHSVKLAGARLRGRDGREVHH